MLLRGWIVPVGGSTPDRHKVGDSIPDRHRTGIENTFSPVLYEIFFLNFVSFLFRFCVEFRKSPTIGAANFFTHHNDITPKKGDGALIRRSI